ncbi:MAG: binding-protein-dependent transport system inner rane component [Anaerocolumna sp.]|nr:binding-protein-dependent transport system inner rane component [Anaerocolumna sp.]
MDKIYRNKTAIILFVAPAFILFTAVLLVPICQALYYSLCNWNALTGAEFTGLDNYKKLFTEDTTMRTALKNSIFFMLFSAISQQFMGLLLAALLTNVKRGRNLFKNIYYLPAVLSSAALGLLWSFLFNPKPDWYKRSLMADGYKRVYCPAHVGNCFCGLVAICGYYHDVIYGADCRDLRFAL